MEKKNKLFLIILLQAAVIIFALSSAAGKYASKYDFLSFNYIVCYAIEILLLGIYAIFWQQLIKKIDISIAYSNKATNIFWSLIIASFLFQEKITLTNILGAIVIFIGIIMVNKND